MLIAKIFHRFEIEQRVHRLGVGVGIALVHFAAEGDTPAGDGEGEPGIGHHHGQRHRRDHPIQLHHHIYFEGQKLEDSGENAEQSEGQQIVDALDAAVNHPRQAAGLAFQMKAQRQGMNMREGLHRDFPHGMIEHLGEDAVAQLTESLHQNAGNRIGADERQGQADGDGGGRLDRQLIGDLPHQKREIEGRRNSQHHAEQRDDHPQTQAHIVGPEIGQQRPERPQRRGAVAFFNRMGHALFSHIGAAEGEVAGGQGDQRNHDKNNQPAAHDFVLCPNAEPV